jgi:hypothetical protein
MLHVPCCGCSERCVFAIMASMEYFVPLDCKWQPSTLSTPEQAAPGMKQNLRACTALLDVSPISAAVVGRSCAAVRV